MKTMLKVFNFTLVTFLVVSCQKNGKDESRPYEFGFTIDGEQHRHEKKDVNGIIEGEFGFITADGIYHVTVYATDENGNFKILSMRNVRISAPLDGSPLPPGAKIEGGQPGGNAPSRGQQVQPQAPIQALQTTTRSSRGPFDFTTQPTIKPACGGCGYVTTPKPKPGQPFPFQTPAFQKPASPQTTGGNTQQGINPGANYPDGGNNYPGSNNPQSGGVNYPQGPGVQQINYPQGPGVQQTNYPEGPGVQQPNYPQRPGGEQSNYPQGPGVHQTNYPQGPGVQQTNYPQGQGVQQTNYPQRPGVQQTNYPQGPGAQQTNYPQGPGFQQTNYPQGGGVEQNGIQPGANYPQTGSPSPFQGTTVSNGAIHVPGNPDIPIRDKFPGMSDGLPEGINEKDISDLLYKFHYTVGFHGHYEMGLKNGAKVGGYFVNGRDGVSRVVTYVADENGFRPKVKFIRLDLNSDEVPKEGTEKTFGLKSFEFVWYPIK